MTTAKLILFGCLIVAVILHEISHGIVALFYGDDTAKRAGRLTLNPVPHIDPVGSVILPAMAVLGGFPFIGWAKPVPVDPMKLRDPRRQMLYVGLIGPFTNFALMAAAAVVARGMADGPGIDARDVVESFAYVNLFLGIFNLLPIPPLDGSSLIERLLPSRSLAAWYRFRPYGILVLFLGVFYLDVFGRIIEPFAEVLQDFIG